MKIVLVIHRPIPRLTTIFHQFLFVFARVTGICKNIPMKKTVNDFNMHALRSIFGHFQLLWKLVAAILLLKMNWNRKFVSAGGPKIRLLVYERFYASGKRIWALEAVPRRSERSTRGYWAYLVLITPSVLLGLIKFFSWKKKEVSQFIMHACLLLCHVQNIREFPK